MLSRATLVEAGRQRHHAVPHIRLRFDSPPDRWRVVAEPSTGAPKPVREQIDTLFDEYTDAQVAHILNERGASTGAGASFNPDSIRWVRCSARLKSLKERLLEAGMLTGKQACTRLGVSRDTLRRWRAQGRIKARICNDKGECLYWLPEPAAPPTTPINEPLLTSAAGGFARGGTPCIFTPFRNATTGGRKHEDSRHGAGADPGIDDVVTGCMHRGRPAAGAAGEQPLR